MVATCPVGVQQVPKIDFRQPENSNEKGVLRKIESQVCTAVKTVFEGFRLFFVRCGQVRKNTNAFARTIQLSSYAFSAAEIISNKQVDLSDISLRLGVTKNVVDSIQTLDGIHYFRSNKTDKSALNYIGNASMVVATFGVGVSILDSCKLLSLGKIAARIGAVPVFGSITRIGLNFGQMMTSFAALGYGCFAIDAAVRVKSSKDGDAKRQAWIDTAWFVAEVASAVFVLCAGTCIGGVIALGSVAATLGIASYMHKIAVKEFESQKAALLSAVKS